MSACGGRSLSHRRWASWRSALVDLIAQASEAERRCVALAPPGDKPFILEMALFYGHEQGPDRIRYTEWHRKANDASVVVYLTTPYPNEPYLWRDRLILERKSSQWRISDFVHENRPISTTLKDYVKNAASCLITGP